MDAHETDPVLPAEVQEHPELADAPEGVAELADDHLVSLGKPREHPPPLRTVLLLGAFLLDDGIAAERAHPREVFVPRGEVLREEEVSDPCHE